MTVTRQLKAALLIDKSPQGTYGGTSFTNFTVRQLNTKVYDTIGITLASNVFSVPSGLYRCSITAPFVNFEVAQVALYDELNAIYADRVNIGKEAIGGTPAVLNTLMGGNTAYSVRTRVTTVQFNSGRGTPFDAASPLPSDEIYTRVFIQALDYETFAQEYAQFTHVEAQGTGGGSYVKGVWTKRTFNTESFNQIPDCSLASSQITLPIGTFRIKAALSNYPNGISVARIMKVSGAPLIIDQTNQQSSPFLHTEGFIVNTEVSVFEIQTYHLGDCPETDGQGKAANVTGVSEYYDKVTIERIA